MPDHMHQQSSHSWMCRTYLVLYKSLFINQST